MIARISLVSSSMIVSRLTAVLRSRETRLETSPCRRVSKPSPSSANAPQSESLSIRNSTPCLLSVGVRPLYGLVSILTRPEGRVLRGTLSNAVMALDRIVSILTRPEGRVLRVPATRHGFCIEAFQSSPAPKGECYEPSTDGAADVHPPEGRYVA